MKKILAVLIVNILALSAARAEDIRALFINMPDSILPTLTKSDRMDFLDYMDSGMKARVINKLGGESMMTKLSDQSLQVSTSMSGIFTMALFPRKDGTTVICIIKGVIADYVDSRLYFYNDDWTPIDSKSLIELPQFDDYLTKEALKNDSLDILKKQSILRLQSVSAVDGGLEFRYRSLDYIGEYADKYRSWFKPEPLRYTWTGKRFKLKK